MWGSTRSGSAQVIESVLAREVIQERAKSLVGGVQTGQQCRELLLLGGRHRRQGIEAGEDEPVLLLGQLDIGDRDGGLVVGEGALDPQVTVDDVPRRLADQDLGDPAALAKGSRQRARCCSTGWLRQLRGLGTRPAGARSAWPTIRLRQPVGVDVVISGTGLASRRERSDGCPAGRHGVSPRVVGFERDS